MKKSYLYIVLLSLIFSACRKEDKRIFSETADQRLNKILTDYQNELTASPNGWKAIITPGNGISYQFYFKFSTSNRVITYADFDSTTASIPRESSYRLKALQQPSLVFDTYSYVHLLADPTPSVNDGQVGAGLSSDFEFAFLGKSGDTIKLIGRVNKTKVSLVKATSQEATLWMNQSWARALSSVNDLNKIIQYFKRLTLNGVQYEILIDKSSRTVIITWVDAGGITRTFTSGFTFSAASQGITFNSPLNTGNGVIAGVYGITFDALTSRLNLTVGNNVAATIVGAIRPVSPDVAAGRRFYNLSANSGSYWVSITGFTVNGVEDGFGLRTIPNYQYLLYWAAVGSSGGISYDITGPVINNNVPYGIATRTPIFVADGRLIFQILGTTGGTPPPNIATIMTNMRVMLTDPAGFWVVQTSQDSYDLVSAKDAKSWITYYWVW